MGVNPKHNDGILPVMSVQVTGVLANPSAMEREFFSAGNVDLSDMDADSADEELNQCSDDEHSDMALKEVF